MVQIKKIVLQNVAQETLCKYKNNAKSKTQTSKTNATEKLCISSEHNGRSPGLQGQRRVEQPDFQCLFLMQEEKWRKEVTWVSFSLKKNTLKTNYNMFQTPQEEIWVPKHSHKKDASVTADIVQMKYIHIYTSFPLHVYKTCHQRGVTCPSTCSHSCKLVVYTISTTDRVIKS